jgi:GH25 family lysozyme M1 (1,4-beta-N-acetylmuramidase)
MLRARLTCLVLLGVAFAGCLGGSAPTPEDNGAEEAPVCAAGATVNGIDVSYYQGKIDWNAAKGGGIDFAFARVSDGTGFIDPQFAANWANMKAAGVVRGAYQFFRPETDPVAQANLMLSQINAAGGLQPGDLAPVIDVEVTDSVAASTIVSRITTWLQTVESATGLIPTIYTSPGFWPSLGNPTGFGKYALWVANWGVSCPSVPTASWSNWRFWQNADTGNVPGVGSGPDLDKFNGSLSDLLAFAAGKGGSGSSSSSSSSSGGPPTCQVKGVAGTCIDTSVCASMPGHVSSPGYCPGPATEQCCTPTGSSSSSSSTSSASSTSSSSSSSTSSSSSSSTSSSSSSSTSSSGAPPPTCNVGGVAGTCISTSTCAGMTGYTSTPGYCPGPATEECCTPPPSCNVGGVAGVCIQTSLCATLPGHKSTPGYCPGPASEECCTP